MNKKFEEIKKSKKLKKAVFNIYGTRSAIIKFNMWAIPRRIVLNCETNKVYTTSFKPARSYVYTLEYGNGPLKTKEKEIEKAATVALQEYYLSLAGDMLAIDPIAKLVYGEKPKEV